LSKWKRIWQRSCGRCSGRFKHYRVSRAAIDLKASRVGA
jgi:hypothetical protein